MDIEAPKPAAARNRLGGISLAIALSGFVVVELQPWLGLDSIVLFGGLSLKGLLAAFFEASTVGALADWFAVTALFRNPLGVKLPHTDILAKNKDAIANAVPRFLSGFVTPAALKAELGRVDFASRIAEAIEAGPSRSDIHAFLRRRAAEFLRDYGGERDDRAAALRRFVSGLLGFASSRVDPSAAAAGLLRWARRERFDERAIDLVAEWLREGIGRNRLKLIRILTPILKENAGWQGLFMGPGTVERALAGVQTTLTEIKTDKANEARRLLVSSLSETADRLAGDAPDPTLSRARLDAAFRDALADEGLAQAVSGFVGRLLASLGDDLASAEGGSIGALERFEDAFVARLRDDEATRSGVNAAVASVLTTVIERGKVIEGLTEYLAGLLRATDERFFVARIEDAVWNDLQFIRVNGAVVGGLVGLCIALIKAAIGA